MILDHGDREGAEKRSGLLAGFFISRPVDPPPHLGASVVR